MEQRKLNRRLTGDSNAIESLLADYYGQLLKWGLTLTRGDNFKAQDIVQELCLYFTLTRPDLRAIANVNGYLYTCLRHIYTSSMARASREAIRFVSVADFDSFEAAIASTTSHDLLQRQNDLRRICSYAVWRKESSKTASYFILHYFHGYSRSETADVACVPLSAIYNKLKLARSEVKSHLEDSKKLRVLGRNTPTDVPHSKTLSDSVDFFHELRQAILNARTSECLPDGQLIAHYESSPRLPIDCDLLSHIASCERCLAILDQHFRRPTLTDREPLDVLDASSFASASGNGRADLHAMSSSVRRRARNVYEHRPNILSIALNGKLVASHNVQGTECSLSARIDSPEKADFVEVFSEQDVRLAFLPITARPPIGPELLSQRLSLSDGRWLELCLSFDGLGLSAEVKYFDPVLAFEGVAVAEEIFGEEGPFQIPNARGVLHPKQGRLPRLLELVTRPLVIRWSFAIVILTVTLGYLNYRHMRSAVTPDEILNESARTESANLRGQVKHQTLRLEETLEDMKVVQQDTVELWRDGDGSRSIRRLYDAQHNLLALAWRNRKGDNRNDDAQRTLREDGLLHVLWDQDLSATAFRSLAGEDLQLVRRDGEVTLTTVGASKQHPEIVFARLTLDDKLMPIRQDLRVRTATGIREVHFVQTNYERRPSGSVPDSLFEPSSALRKNGWTASGVAKQNFQPQSRPPGIAPLQIAVLYQLNLLGADIGQPIEMSETAAGHIRIAGTVTDSELRQKIIFALQHMENAELLDIRILSPQEAKKHLDTHPASRMSTVYEVGQSVPPVDAKVRQYLMSRGLTGQRLDAAVDEYYEVALRHAQRSLQNAHALNRLGQVLSNSDLNSLPLAAEQQWAVMAQNHASDLEDQLQSLQAQLREIGPSGDREPTSGSPSVLMKNPRDFARVASEQLQQMQRLESNIGNLLTSNAALDGSIDVELLLSRTTNTLPVQTANDIARFATTLNASAKAALAEQER